MKPRIRTLALVLATSLAACDDVTDIIPGETYDLVQAEGQELPAVVFDGETDFGHVIATAISGSITLRETTFTERVVFDITLEGTPLGEETVTLSGDYSADGPLLTFDPDRSGAPTFTGTRSGVTLTTVETHPDYGELTLVWQR